MTVTEHFDTAEFACKDSTPYPKAWIETRLRPLCEALEKIRAKVGKPIKINSGYRTLAHNKKVGGSQNSRHMQGIAADISVPGLNARVLYQIILKMIQDKEIPQGGLGSYKTWVHYDLRGVGVRWRV